MKSRLSQIAALFDIQTSISLAGLALLAAGLSMVFLPLALIVPGGILLAAVAWGNR